ncbi:MAG: o-succinylbenzoate--CoA ligase [Rhodospirillaceae bacterium]|nr:o-succinylbenzoate--CoA ligase [Rhodospirillaceae bacterium]|tara:strand:- start:14442 stop:15995 length:1554 start_codon:yes stop_codon:yes gene_type:complete
MRLIDFFERGVRFWPDTACLVDPSGSQTYTEVSIRSHQTASALVSNGLKPGGIVAILSQNCSKAFEAWIGAARADGVWVGLAALNSVSENTYILNHRSAEWLFIHSDFKEQIPQIRKDCPDLKHIICLDEKIDGYQTFEEFIQGHSDFFPEITYDRDSIISHFSSGGTTGQPKGALWTSLTWQAWSANVFAHLPIKKRPVHLVASSMAHGAGVFVWPIFAFGGTIVSIPKADPNSVLKAIQIHGVTHTFLPPTVIYMMLAYPEAKQYDCSSMDYLIYGGAPMSADKVKEAIDVFGPCMTQIYGQAECPVTIGILTPEEHIEAVEDPSKQHRLLSCGRAPVFVQTEIMDDDGLLVNEGEWGEIVVRGEIVSLGYFGDREATAAIQEHGWHHTGDVGYKDNEGYIYIVDRKKDMIISGGLNVFPIEIERLIWSFEEVQDCVVIGIPDEKWGEAVKAVIELKSEQILHEDDVIKLCKSELAAYKVPKTVEFWDELPRSPVGKVLKKEVRKKFWAGVDRKI